jgi:hypothetical protein
MPARWGGNREPILGAPGEPTLRTCRKRASLTEANQLDPLKTYFGSQSCVEVAAGVTYHSYNHYGQMVVYARMNGVVPPASQR